MNEWNQHDAASSAIQRAVRRWLYWRDVNAYLDLLMDQPSVLLQGHARAARASSAIRSTLDDEMLGSRFKKIFEQADMDEDGKIDIAEYERIVMSVSRTFLQKGYREDAEWVWKLLDNNYEGRISMREFCWQIFDVQGGFVGPCCGHS